MATWYTMECPWEHGWEKFSPDDVPPSGDELVCPECGRESRYVLSSDMGRTVRITIAAATGPAKVQGDTRARYFLELSTWDGADVVLSQERYSWEDAVRKAEQFRNLSWEDAERRWKRMRM